MTQIFLNNGRNFANLLLRHFSSAEKYRYLQEIKNDSLECLNSIPTAKFIAFSGNSPLIVGESNIDLVQPSIRWLQFSDLMNHKEYLLSSAVLIGSLNDKTLQFGVQLGKLKEQAQEELEERTNSKFINLRSAMFSLKPEEGQILSKTSSLLRFHKEHQYCGHCGGKARKNAAGSSRHCLKCSKFVYPQIQPVGIVMVTDENRKNAVLVRHSKHPSNLFTCVAGFSDVGETIEETVHREVCEEIGLEVNSISYFKTQHWPFPSSLMFACYAVAKKEQLKLDSSELAEGRWFSRDEIKSALQRSSNRNFLKILLKNGFNVSRNDNFAGVGTTDFEKNNLDESRANIIDKVGTTDFEKNNLNESRANIDKDFEESSLNVSITNINIGVVNTTESVTGDIKKHELKHPTKNLNKENIFFNDKNFDIHGKNLNINNKNIDINDEKSENNSKLVVPPPGPVAHLLIKNWVENFK